MNDQRAVLLPLPISASSSTLRPMTTILPTSQTKNSLSDLSSKTLPDGDFFSLLNRLQTRQTTLSSTFNTRLK